ncbi:MAG TPA: SAVED domain-containing protein [Rubrobacteraceae bacterium]|nr:SAVED domain-containing protein [Rubrobacteraceae bacterium]
MNTLRPERVLLVSQPILAPINEDQMLNAMSDEHRQVKRSTISIEPTRMTLAELAAIDWAEVCLAQEREFKSKLEPALQNASGYRLAYFGLAPIPLAVHLGYRVGGMIDIDVYLLHHERKTWEWPQADQEPAPLDLLDIKLPQDISRARGDVIVRVSVSHRIDPVETLEVVPDPLCEIDIGLVHPDEDALRSSKDLDAIVHQFNRAIDAVKDRYPNTERIHLFAAVPVGLAFRLGTCLNPTIHAPVQTYQYFARRSPRYQRAFVLQAEITSSAQLTQEEVAQAAGTRSLLSEELELLKEYGESLREQAGKQSGTLNWWERVLPKTAAGFHGRLAQLVPLYETHLLKDEVDLGVTEVSDSFRYTSGRWELGDHLLAAIGRRLLEPSRRARAGRMLLLHETIHHQCHGLTSETSASFRRFPKVLEEIDYQADVWTMIHEYGFARRDNRDAAARKETRNEQAFFRGLIDTALESFWAFDDRSSTLDQIEIRRLNRYLIWYWQYLRMERCSSLDDVLNVLAERPLIEIAGPRVRLANERVVYLLDQPYDNGAEICLLEENWVYRPGHSAGTRVKDVLDGFRERDSSRIRQALKSVFDQFVRR